VLSRPLRGPVSPYYYAVCPTPRKNVREPAEVEDPQTARGSRSKSPHHPQCPPRSGSAPVRAAVNPGDIFAPQVDPDLTATWPDVGLDRVTLRVIERSRLIS